MEDKLLKNQKGCIGCLGVLIILALVFFGIVINHLLTNETVKEENTVKEEQTETANPPKQAPTTKNKSSVPSTPATKVNGRILATVLSVVDGDTIKVDLDGKEETIRLVLVDTPETKHPRTGVQPFGPEATEFTTKQLMGKEIHIEPGIEERDRYGRLLAYVYIEDKMFNKMLLEKGLARVAVYPPNTKYLDEFEKIQSEAKQKEIGIWSIENYATADGYQTKEKEQSPPAPEPAPQPHSDSSIVAESYKNCTELRKVHPDGVPSSHPAYDTKHDRDNDGFACERN